MNKTFSLFVLFFVVFLSINNACESSNLRYQDYLPASRNTILIQDSPEEDLRKSYNAMRKVLTLNTFETRVEDFEDQIFDPINMNNIPDQTEYMNEIRDLKNKLNNIQPNMIRSFFSDHKSKFGHRLSLAKIDQQLFNHNAIRSNFNHGGLPFNVQGVLNSLVGKIFHISEDDTYTPHIRHVGSGMLANFNLNNPVDLTAGNLCNLNGVITCAHVIASEDDERTTGVYFVPNDALDLLTGFPAQLPNGNPLVNANDLMNYLTTSMDSYQINTYITRKRIGMGVQLFPGNSITETNPQYFDNEDIIFGNIQLNVADPNNLQQLRQFNNLNITVNFSTIRNNLALPFINGDQYFAIGYPGCDHYSLLPFQNQNYHNPVLIANPHPQSNLIEDRGYSPLLVTSSMAQNQGNPNQFPRFNNGLVHHEAPTAKGMSGGSLVKISNGGNQIDFFGVISAGSDNSEEGCY